MDISKSNYLKIGGVLLLVAVLVFVFSQQKSDSPSKTSQSSQVTAQSLHTDCEAKAAPSEKFDCYEVAFTGYMKDSGAKQTLQLLDQIQQLGGYAQTNCHPLTHKIGNIALHQYGTVLNAVPEYLPVCHSGYYHGLLEEYLATAPDYETGVKTVCGPAEGKVYFNWFQCVHGLGHGVMQYRQDEVPQSLKDCDLIDPGSQAQEICYAGVFMENITTDEKTGHPSKYIKAENPIYPCDFVETKYKNACYFLSSSMILRLNNYDFPDAFKTCATKAEENYKWLCYQSLGRDVSGSSLRNNQQVNDLCLLGDEAGRNECFFGAVRDYINEKGEFDTAIGLCEFIPDAYHQKCYDAVFLDLALFKKGQDFVAVCAKMPEPYSSQCRLRAVN